MLIFVINDSREVLRCKTWQVNFVSTKNWLLRCLILFSSLCCTKTKTILHIITHMRLNLLIFHISTKFSSSLIGMDWNEPNKQMFWSRWKATPGHCNSSHFNTHPMGEALYTNIKQIYLAKWICVFPVAQKNLRTFSFARVCQYMACKVKGENIKVVDVTSWRMDECMIYVFVIMFTTTFKLS